MAATYCANSFSLTKLIFLKGDTKSNRKRLSRPPGIHLKFPWAHIRSRNPSFRVSSSSTLPETSSRGADPAIA
jgi:hypothetical protein